MPETAMTSATALRQMFNFSTLGVAVTDERERRGSVMSVGLGWVFVPGYQSHQCCTPLVALSKGTHREEILIAIPGYRRLQSET